METETTQPFSFEGKSVAIFGSHGKMGTAYAQRLRKAGAEIHSFERWNMSTNNPGTDLTLFATSECITIEILDILGFETRKKPIITTSSTNGKLAEFIQSPEGVGIQHLTPIHVLSGPRMKGAVMIDCTDVGTLSRSIAEEIARVFEMEREEVPLLNHDSTIALGQAKFHLKVWKFIQEIPDLIQWAKLLPISQRRAAIGELRILMRPDISAELMSSFPENIQLIQPDHLPVANTHGRNTFESVTKSVLENWCHKKDPNGLIRAWVKSENERMDQGVPGGPRSFQEFLRSNK